MSFNEELSYNQYKGLSSMPYKIVSHMIKNNEDIFKMLKYDTSDALSKANLTTSEKRNLIYKGQVEDSTSYKIFLQPITDDAFPERASLFRVFIDYIYPTNSIVGLTTFVFEILTHNKINWLDNDTTRLHYMLEEVLRTFNGSFVEGVGDLFFNAEASRRMNYARQNIYNGKNYFGYTICMSTWIGNVK